MGIGNRIKSWLLLPKPAVPGTDMTRNDNSRPSEHSSLREFNRNKQKNKNQKEKEERRASVPLRLDTLLNVNYKPKIHNSSEDQELLLYVAPVQGYTERPVDCHGLQTATAISAAAVTDLPVTITTEYCNKLTTADKKLLRKNKNNVNGRRPASTSVDCLHQTALYRVKPFPNNLGNKTGQITTDRRQKRLCQSIYDLDRLAMSAFKSTAGQNLHQKNLSENAELQGKYYDSKLKFRENFVKGLWTCSSNEPLKNSRGRKTNAKLGSDEAAKLFNSYFSVSFDNAKKSLSSESGVATDEEQHKVALEKQDIPEVAKDYMLVMDHINDINYEQQPVSPETMPSSVSPKQTSLVSTATSETIRKDEAFIADVILEIGASTCDIMYKLNDRKSVRKETESCECCILFYPDGRFHSFGLAARQFYCDLDPEDAQRFLFFQNFRSHLFKNTPLSKKRRIRSVNGRDLELRTVLTECLRHFALKSSRVLSHLNNSPTIDSDSVSWRIILPLVSDPSVAQMVRHCAHQAGLSTSKTDNQLVLIDKLDIMASLSVKDIKSCSSIGFLPSDSFIILHADYDLCQIGGYEIDANDRLIEKFLPKVENCGIKWISDSFGALLGEIFGKNFIVDFTRRYCGPWMELMSSFESKYSSFMSFPVNGLQMLSVSVPWIFAEKYKKKTGAKLSSAVRSYNHPDVTFSEQGHLKLSANCVRNLEGVTIGRLLSCLGHTICELSAPKYLLVTGPWSASVSLTEQISRTFSSTLMTKVINHSKYGEICHKHIPRRLSPVTLGLAVLYPFDANTHPILKRVRKQGKNWCIDIFDRVLTKGLEIQETSRRYCPAESRQKEVVISVFCSSQSAHPQFISDSGVFECGMIRLPLQQHIEVNNDKSQEVQVTINSFPFNMTATDLNTGLTSTVDLNFLLGST